MAAERPKVAIVEYPLIDRSGVDDDPPPMGTTSVPTPTVQEIHVCQAGSCRRAGGEALLLEIEELATAAGTGCTVHATGCVGACSQAPNAVSVRVGSRRERLHARLDSVEKSAAAVAAVTGVAPDLSDPALVERLGAARRMRARTHARKEQKWNAALNGLAAEVAALAAKAGGSADAHAELQYEQAQLELAAGRWEAAAALLRAVCAHFGPQPPLVAAWGDALGRL